MQISPFSDARQRLGPITLTDKADRLMTENSREQTPCHSLMRVTKRSWPGFPFPVGGPSACSVAVVTLVSPRHETVKKVFSPRAASA
jgi:hypothetical protein